MIKNVLISNNKIRLKRFSSRLLSMSKGAQKIDEVLETILKCDETYFVDDILDSIYKENTNAKRKLLDRGPEKSTRSCRKYY